MKVNTERTPECSAIVRVEVDDEQMDRALKTAARKISRARPMPGFRPGKAPYAVVQRVVGKDTLREEAIEELAQSIYKQVLKDEDIDPYDTGKLDVEQKEPLVLKFTIPTRPVITLGDYTSIHRRPNVVSVTAEEVDEVLYRFQQEQAQMVPVTRPVQMGDLATIDVQGSLEGQDPTNNKGLQVRIEKEKPTFPWIEQLVGMNANETRTIAYAYPEDKSNPNLAGKSANYTVTVTDVKEPHLPSIDDELAKTVSQYETLEQLKSYIRHTLLQQKETEEENRFTDEVVDAVVEQSQISYPPSMVDDELNQEVERSKDLAKRLGLTWAKYLDLSGKNEADFREEARPRAEKRLKRLLVVLKLVEAEKTIVSSKEVDVEIDRRARDAVRTGGRADQVRRTLSNASSRKDIEFNLKMAKTIGRIVAMAKGEPTSGKIVTPEMLREEQRAREQADQSPPAPSGDLITDPSKIRAEDWPRGLDRPIIPGQE